MVSKNAAHMVFGIPFTAIYVAIVLNIDLNNVSFFSSFTQQNSRLYTCCFLIHLFKSLLPPYYHQGLK